MKMTRTPGRLIKGALRLKTLWTRRCKSRESERDKKGGTNAFHIIKYDAKATANTPELIVAVVRKK